MSFLHSGYKTEYDSIKQVDMKEKKSTSDEGENISKPNLAAEISSKK